LIIFLYIFLPLKGKSIAIKIHGLTRHTPPHTPGKLGRLPVVFLSGDVRLRRYFYSLHRWTYPAFAPAYAGQAGQAVHRVRAGTIKNFAFVIAGEAKPRPDGGSYGTSVGRNPVCIIILQSKQIALSQKTLLAMINAKKCWTHDTA